ncbi:hypothetical protein BD779DRAFT_1681396 [Infundibulicybe gibba]|nr:hypothetical protein BD779DRAFT_1681396 [Infundibulicybe gibba]
MQLSTIFIFASLALTGLASPNARGTVAQVEADIVKITDQARALDAATAKLSSGGGSLQMLVVGAEIETNVLSLKTAINAGTADVKAIQTPIAESDAQRVFTAVQALEPDITDGLNRLVASKSLLTGLPVPGVSTLVLQYVKGLQATTDDFASALIVAAPADLKSEGNALKANIDAKFATAIAAYT